jgi:hypothetical protein
MEPFYFDLYVLYVMFWHQFPAETASRRGEKRKRLKEKGGKK